MFRNQETRHRTEVLVSITKMVKKRKTSVRKHIRKTKKKKPTVVKRHRRRVKKKKKSYGSIPMSDESYRKIKTRKLSKKGIEKLLEKDRRKHIRKQQKTLGLYTGDVKGYDFVENPEDRRREQRRMKKRLDDFKDWAKKSKLKNSSEIIEFDGMNGFGIRGFDSSSGPAVDWKTTVGDYIKDSKIEIKGRDKLIREAEEKALDYSAIRLGRFRRLK